MLRKNVKKYLPSLIKEYLFVVEERYKYIAKSDLWDTAEVIGKPRNLKTRITINAVDIKEKYRSEERKTDL